MFLHLGQDAYEGYQIFVYMKELLRVRQTDYLCWSPAFEFLYVAMVILSQSKRIPFLNQNKKIRFEEIGSTFFVSIDKLAKLESLYLEGIKLKEIWFYGVEVSQIFSDIAVEMHSGYHLNHYHHVSQIPLLPEIGIGRSYQATSYAFSSTQEFADWLCRLRFSLNGAWFNPLSGDLYSTVLGKQITLFDADWLISHLQDRGYRFCLISSDLCKRGNLKYLSVWFVVHNLTEPELDKFISVSAKHNNFGYSLDWKHSASAQVLRDQARDAGEHAGMIFSDETNSLSQYSQTFNFGNPEIVKQFSKYLESLQSSQGNVENE